MKLWVCLALITLGIVSTREVEDKENGGFLEKIEGSYQDESGDVSLSFDNIVTTKGYPLSIYYVTTSDGYILKLYRISGPKGSPQVDIKDPKRRVVLLQHGVSDSSDSWVSNYEDKALPFILANEGYDVWLGNNRGNKYSRVHLVLNPDTDREFWNFSYHEMGTKDIPTMIEFIVSETGREKISFIGHSQGNAQLFAALTLMEDYFASRLNCFLALGPVTNVYNIQSTFLRILAESRLDELFLRLNLFNEFLPNKASLQVFENYLCKNLNLFCSGLLEILADAKPEVDDMNRLLVFIGHYPSGSSMLSMNHFTDSIKHNRFAQLDGTPYDLSKIKNVPVALFVGKEDLIATLADNRNLKQILSNSGSLQFYREYEDMGHSTFFLSKKNEYVNDVINVLELNNF